MPTPPLSRFTSIASHLAEREPPIAVVVETELVPVDDDDRPAIEDLIELARIDRALRRADLHTRYAIVALAPDPQPWFGRPWARLGAAALVGFALGRSRILRVAASVTFGAMLALAVDRALAHTAPAPARG
jgi:hypothetical protein